MSQKQIIMNFSAPPSLDDMGVIATEMFETLPEELVGFCDGLAIQIEDWPDASVEQDMDLDDSYELLALYKSGKEISPGVERKTANDDDVLILYRRPILDMWCDRCEDLSNLVREVMIEELGQHFDFSEDEIEEMAERHYQGML